MRVPVTLREGKQEHGKHEVFAYMSGGVRAKKGGSLEHTEKGSTLTNQVQ